MTQKLFSILDSKGKMFNRPFTAITHGDAERTFQSTVNHSDPQNLIHQYPEDFDLYYVGDFDPTTGKIVTPDSPQHMIKAIAVKKS